MADIVERAMFEIAEDRRIAALMRQERNRTALLQRAAVTEELVAELKAARAQRDEFHAQLDHECAENEQLRVLHQPLPGFGGFSGGSDV
jgi:hypothetical protein